MVRRSQVDRTAALFGVRRRSRAAPLAAVELARSRIAATLPGPGTPADQLGAIELAAEALGALWLERDWSHAAVDDALAELARLLDLPQDAVRVAVGARVLGDSRLLELPPRIAIDVQLGKLRALAPVERASLWTLDDAGVIACLGHVDGAAGPSRGARAAALGALRPPPGRAGAGDAREPSRGLLVAPVVRWQQVRAALVCRPAAGGRATAQLLLELAARPLGPVLERATLLERNRSRERALTGALERRLTRFGLDLHDGPIQDVAATARDAQLFRRQLGQALRDHPGRELLLGRVDDLTAQLGALDTGLRGLARSIEGLTVKGRPLADALKAEVAALGADGIACALELDGSFEVLTTSQQIAVVQIVRESLANVREHSGARNVRVRVAELQTHLALEVTDDGRGFDVDPTLVRSARAGHFGLVGVSERARLLGGTCRIESRPGGPTTVSAALPRWQPELADERANAVGERLPDRR